MEIHFLTLIFLLCSSFSLGVYWRVLLVAIYRGKYLSNCKDPKIPADGEKIVPSVLTKAAKNPRNNQCYILCLTNNYEPGAVISDIANMGFAIVKKDIGGDRNYVVVCGNYDSLQEALAEDYVRKVIPVTI
jgi:hypothetical protein